MKEEDIGYMIKRLDRRLKARADQTFLESDLTYAQVRVLKIIWEHGGQLTQKEIEDVLKVSHPTVVGLVGRLEKSGYVSCHVDPADRRNKIVCGTDRSTAHREWHEARMRETERLLTAGFSEEELTRLRDMLRRLYQNME